MHPKIGVDLRILGLDKLEVKNIVAVRSESKQRRNEKSDIRECIINHAHAAFTETEIVIKDCIDYIPSWQKKVRSVSNNLGLTF